MKKKLTVVTSEASKLTARGSRKISGQKRITVPFSQNCKGNQASTSKRGFCPHSQACSERVKPSLSNSKKPLCQAAYTSNPFRANSPARKGSANHSSFRPNTSEIFFKRNC